MARTGRWRIKSWPMTPRRHPRFPWTTNLKNPTARYSITSMERTSACCWWRKRREGGKRCGNYCGRAVSPLPMQPHGMTFCAAMRALVSSRQISNAACGYRHWASASSPNRNSTASAPCSGAGASGARSRGRHPQPVGAARERPGGPRRPWYWALSRLANPRHWRRPERG